jgi:hypothetical protein
MLVIGGTKITEIDMAMATDFQALSNRPEGK